MKEKFVSPEVTKVEFDPKDVITTSGCVKHNVKYDQVIEGKTCEAYGRIETDDQV